MISACVLLRTERGKFEDVVQKMGRFDGVKRVFPVLGRYDVVVDLEGETFQRIGNTVLKMGRMSGVIFTETLLEIQSER